MKSKPKAVAYVRVSGLGQRDGDGPERQREAVARYCRKARLDLVGEFADLGVSGTTAGADRPGMGELLTEAPGYADVVVIERADRLARDLIEAEVIVRALSKQGVRVVTADGTDLAESSDPTAVLVRQVLGAIAEFDRACTVAKLRAARDRQRRRTGRCEGAKPYGTLPGEAETLAHLRRLARKPRGCDRPTFQAIATAANEAGLLTRSGKPWSRQTIHNVLK